MAELNPPIKAKIQQALKILEEERFVEFKKQTIKDDLFKLDLVTVDVDLIAADVVSARESAQRLDWFLSQLREYTNE